MDVANFLAPHAICLSAEPLLISLLVAFNLGIAIAYFIIPIAMLVYFRLRPMMLTYLFAAFIFGCGLTHVMQVLTMYIGGETYWLEAIACGITVVASSATAIVLMREGPRLLALLTPRTRN
jgi:hypothetical protein